LLFLITAPDYSGLLNTSQACFKIEIIDKINYMDNKVRNIIAIGIGILPINIIMIWYRLTQTESFTTFDMLVFLI